MPSIPTDGMYLRPIPLIYASGWKMNICKSQYFVHDNAVIRWYNLIVHNFLWSGRYFISSGGWQLKFNCLKGWLEIIPAVGYLHEQTTEYFNKEPTSTNTRVQENIMLQWNFKRTWPLFSFWGYNKFQASNKILSVTHDLIFFN